jgi:SWI/SNF-related matrix-associated actin-dependent regulator of chromatin subfamily A member 5
LDEGHRIKNSDTILAKKIQGIGSLFRLSGFWKIHRLSDLIKCSPVLTGTPVQNNLAELWSILHWLYPTVFTGASEQMFRSSFSLSKGTYELGFLNAAKKLLSTIMIRRTKAVVETSVPPREELTVFIPLTEAQRFWYYRLLTRMDTLDLEQIFGATDGGNDQGRQEVKEELKKMMKSPNAHRTMFLYHLLYELTLLTEYRKLLNLLVQLRRLCDQWVP